MQRRIITVLIVLFVLGIMAITNPTKPEFISWIKEKATAHSDGILEKGLLAFFGNDLFEESTTSNNFVFLTIFTTTISNNEHTTVIGLFHNFIPLHLSDDSSEGTTTSSTVSSSYESTPTVTSPQNNTETSEDNGSTPITQPEKNDQNDPIPTTESVRTVKVIGKEGTFVLPVIGVSAQYGIEHTPSPTISPVHDLPDIHYDLPKDRANELAVYWMNTGYGTDNGILLLAPKNWTAKRAGIGADGSFALTITSDPNVKSPESISTMGDGGCTGCAIDNIGIYFPKYKEWAIQNSVTAGKFITSPSNMNTIDIDDHTVSYSYQDTNSLYDTNGVAFEDHLSSPVYFSKVEITNSDKSLATTILNFSLRSVSTKR